MSTASTTLASATLFWRATYFDGRSARKHPVRLRLADGHIVLDAEAPLHSSILGALPRYAIAQARMAEQFANSPCVLDFDDGARLEIADRGAHAAVCQALGYRPSRIERWQHYWFAVLVALVLLVAGVGAAVKWGVPAAAERIVPSLPLSVDRQLGDRAFQAMQEEMFSPSRLSDQRIAEVRAVFDSVRPAATRMPLTLKLMSMDDAPPNAVALPNGIIIMSDEMVRYVMGDADQLDDFMKAQLAGVLAHEIGHVEGRHGMWSVTRGSLLALLSAALFGDFSAVVAGLPALMLNLDYSRDMERAADDYAIARMRQLGSSTVPLAALFESLEETYPAESTLPTWLREQTVYLSSHPATDERSRRLRGEK